MTQLLNARLQWRETRDIERLTCMRRVWFQKDHFDFVLQTKFCNPNTVMALKAITKDNYWQSYPVFLTMSEEILQYLDCHLSGDITIFSDRELPDSGDS